MHILISKQQNYKTQIESNYIFFHYDLRDEQLSKTKIIHFFGMDNTSEVLGTDMWEFCAWFKTYKQTSFISFYWDHMDGQPLKGWIVSSID